MSRSIICTDSRCGATLLPCSSPPATPTTTSQPTQSCCAGPGHDDARALTRLAALDDTTPLTGEVLVAEQDGELRAAISLHSGRAIADPFHQTAGLVRLLRARAALLHAPAHGRRRMSGLLRRPARAA